MSFILGKKIRILRKAEGSKKKNQSQSNKQSSAALEHQDTTSV